MLGNEVVHHLLPVEKGFLVTIFEKLRNDELVLPVPYTADVHPNAADGSYSLEKFFTSVFKHPDKTVHMDLGRKFQGGLVDQFRLHG